MFVRKRAQALIIEDGRVLLAHHFDLTIQEAYWCMPGGGVEAGETPEQAAIRELKEETNLDIRIIRKLGELDLPKVTHGYKLGVTFLAEVISGDIALGHDPEQVSWEDKYLRDIQWLPIDEKLFVQIQSILRLKTDNIQSPSPYVLL